MQRRLAVAAARLLGLAPDRTVFLEGGLGSQLMGMMIYRLRRDVDPTTTCDVSYFFPEIDQPQTTSGATRWPWELHRYGIDLHDSEFIRSPRYRFRRDYLAQAAADEPFALRLAQRDWTVDFPVVPEARERFGDLGLTEDGGYACVHVRRGDYLKVSSRVVTLEESVAVTARFHSMLPTRILFLSDDPFTLGEREEIAGLLPGKECTFIREDDQHIAHALLRMSRVLVTSNSTFSWTAALLMSDPHALALSPTHFFGMDMSAVNNVFQGPANWMMITPRG